ncbi:MAG: metallophosphoesterase family protein [Myxococcales bacterium]|nr:metallophosphoesterase family protein [Myxococcales bacterium]
MRYGIFSDIHANIEALGAVMAAFGDQRIDRFVCIGDTVGYGGAPDECCNLVREATTYTLLGNHDAAVAGRMDYSYYYDAAREALDLHARTITPENLAWLKTLPYEVRDAAQGVAFCHGSPINLEEFEYVFAPEHAERCLQIWQDLAQITFVGHSHLCKAFALTKDEVYEVVADRFELRPGFKYIVSVGSVGQPRDRDPRASYTVYDAETKVFEFLRVPYDTEVAAQRILDAGLFNGFANRLRLGI